MIWLSVEWSMWYSYSCLILVKHLIRSHILSYIFSKLEHCSIDGSVLLCTWIKSFLTCRSQYVVLEGKSSYSKQVLSGGPQGNACTYITTILLCVNDLPASVNNKVKLYICKIVRRWCFALLLYYIFWIWLNCTAS